MRYFSLILVILRFAAVGLIAFGVYTLFNALIVYSSSAVPGGDFGGAVGFARNQAIKSGFTLGCFGLVGYFLAPLLAHLITRGADSDRSDRR